MKKNEPVWSDADDEIALSMDGEGKSNFDIAHVLKRTQSAVKNRLTYLRTVMGLTRRKNYQPRNYDNWPPEPVEWPAMARFEDVKLPPSTLPRFRPVYRPTVFSNMGCAADMCTEA